MPDFILPLLCAFVAMMSVFDKTVEIADEAADEKESMLAKFSCFFGIIFTLLVCFCSYGLAIGFAVNGVMNIDHNNPSVR